MARITFVIPAFNAEATLGDTLGSLLTQTRPDWSAVVVDDGSSDGTAAVARSLEDPRVRVVSQANRGLAGARNTGWRHTDGDAVCFLDADDTVAPPFVARMLGALETFDAAACWYRMVGPALEDLAWVIKPGDHDLAPDRLLDVNPLAVGGVVVRREAVERVCAGRDPFDESLPVHEDWDLWLRLSGAGARWAPMVSEPLFAYRLRKGSLSCDLERMWRFGLRVIDGAPVDARLKPGARRRWSLRHVARAAARGDRDLAQGWLDELGPIDESDAGVLAGAIRWACGQQDQRNPEEADGASWAAWRARVAHALEGRACLAPVMARLAGGAGRFDRAARALIDRVEGGDTVVVYGVGRNGRDLLAAIERWNPRLTMAWMDDHPGASGPTLGGRALPRLARQDLGPGHLVVVTPEQGEAIGQGLRRSGVERVETLDGLVHGRAGAGPAHVSSIH